MMNKQIKDQQKIPEILQHANITTIYKGKGSKKSLSGPAGRPKKGLMKLKEKGSKMSSSGPAGRQKQRRNEIESKRFQTVFERPCGAPKKRSNEI